MASSSSSWPRLRSLCLSLCCIYSITTFPHKAEGVASSPLLGNQYEPKTNVEYIADLTEVLEAIANETSISQGRTFYKRLIPGDNTEISLESLGGGLTNSGAPPPTTITTTTTPPYLDASTNPLYSIYMYAYWRSNNGSGKDGNIDEDRSKMNFLEKTVDYYGHTIINDEFGKGSGYDPELTAETIRVTNLWMATVQALYNAVEMCDEADEDYEVEDVVDESNPVDEAAAFWFGDLDNVEDVSGGTLYAWAKRTRAYFEFDDTISEPLDVNAKIVSGFNALQTMFGECLELGGTTIPNSGGTPDDTEGRALEMRVRVDDLIKYMTVPLVQNLIYHAGDVALAREESPEVDPERTDYMILYALVTLPPIRICDQYAFDDLYKKFITAPKQFTTTTLFDAINSIYGRLVCLGITCNDIGVPSNTINDLGNGPQLPMCQQDPMVDFRGYKATMDPSQFLGEMKVDLDVRTIGTLIEMDANTAAYDVYHWGRNTKDANGKYFSIQTKSMEDYHEKNTVGNAFNSYFAAKIAGGVTNFADEHEYKDMMALGDFAEATPTQRRIIAEATMVAVTMHAFALNCFYKAIDFCNNPADADSEFEDELHWDTGFASLVGWGEETEDARGFMFMEIARFLCESKGSCDATGDSEINKQLIMLLESGKESLTQSSCTAAEDTLDSVEELLKIILIDITAYFAERIAEDVTNVDNVAEGYGVAVALVPLMQNVNSDAASVIEKNMGVFVTESPFPDGRDEVMDALKTLVADADFNCALLTQDICDGSVSPGTNVSTPSTVVNASPSTRPTTRPIANDLSTPDMGEGGSYVEASCESGIDGGMPSSDGIPSSPLLGSAYTPTSNVDHIIQLTDMVGLVEKSAGKAEALTYYTKVSDGVSLECLSTETQWLQVTESNPLYVIYMYGLWVSDDGDNDNDGYSNKVFDEGPILNYGDTIVRDEFDKASGFNAELSAETIRVMNMWMAMTTELYRAAESCRDGYINKAPSGFNPVDFAAAFWYGSAENPDLTDNASLYAWAKRAEKEVEDQSMTATEAIRVRLEDLQKSFQDCSSLGVDQREKKGIEMTRMVDDTTRWMVVPVVQNFIYQLAAESGMGPEVEDERNSMVLYALTVLPFISICDEDTFDDLFSDLITNVDSYDTSTFNNHLKLVQDRYDCLGINCDMVGHSTYWNTNWAKCEAPSLSIAGYTPTSDASLEMAKIDLDISTILSFIIMEANSAALDIYENGRNAKDETGLLALKTIGIPDINQDAITIYNQFASDYDRDYTSVTKNAIMGEGEFFWSSILKNSAAASLAIATIDMHMNILDNLYQAVECDPDGQSVEGWDHHWDNAVASVVGWSEGTEDGGSGIDGYLFFQLAEELCEHFDNCDVDGQSKLNKKIMAEFKTGQEKLTNNLCVEAASSRDAIELYLQAILVDNLAYHAKFADSNRDERHCLMAHVAKNALVPMMRPISAPSADAIEEVAGATDNDCRVDDVEVIYGALKEYVGLKEIDCSWLSSSVCDGSSTTIDDDLENNSEYTPNPEDDPDTVENERFSLLKREYIPLSNVQDILESTPVSAICSADADSGNAKVLYSGDEKGISIKSMSTSAKYAMADELQFNQYVYALQDNVDKTDGSLLFDGKPASEYANTITSDALDTSITLGCQAVKVLNIWMWVVHKLNDAVNACKRTDGPSLNYGVLDEAAALWEGGLLFEMAEDLGRRFGHEKIEGMTFLNRQIVERLKKAQSIISASQNECNNKQTHDLRIIVKETITYMTALLIQSLIDSMFDDTSPRDKEEMVELMAFATLPHIKTCGHDTVYDTLYNDLVIGNYDADKRASTVNDLQRHYNCLGLSCSDVGRHISFISADYLPCSDNLDIAGYTPANATKTNMIAKIDLDAVAIHQMSSMDKYDIAKRIYREGHNYYDYDNQEDYNFVSLHNLTQSTTIEYTSFPIYELFDNYQGSDFGNTLIIQALNRAGPFKNTTTTQRDLAVNVAISSFVSYMAALEAFYYAASRCSSEREYSETAFDGAVALLIGSVEGRGRGGNSQQEGRMFYSIGKRNCAHFRGTCQGSDAEVNVQLFRVLEEGQNFIQQGKCEDAAKAVESINTLLKVPLIQSLLYFSDSTIAMQSDDVAAGYVATMAVLPILDKIDTPSANSINSVMDITTSSPMSSESKEEEVYNSLQAVLSNPASQLDCKLVTKIDEICTPVIIDDPDTPEDESEVDVEVIDPEEPTPMSNGLYVSTNYVGDRSSIALDVQEIEERLQANDVDNAKYYYTKGLNSKVYDENGIPSGELRSISRFSTESGSTMKGDPTYNLFIHGLSDKNQEFLGKPATNFADSFISDLLYNGLPEASRAMVAVSIWQQVAHSLHSAYGACKMSFLADGRTINSRDLQNMDPSLMIDEAAAYWIGDNQATGSSSKGHLLYALTESIGEEFERTPDGTESYINTQIVDLFNKAKNHIAISRGCSTSEDSHLKLKEVVDELIPLMAVPLLRCLLFYMSVDKPVLVKVYAVAVLPLFSACAPSIYNELKDELIDHDVIEIQKKYIYSKIQSMYSCLGLTCNLVGSMEKDDVLKCNDSSDLKSLAGYRYVTDQNIVNRASHMDVDMKKVEILIENGLTHFADSEDLLFGTAFDLYQYGQHFGENKSSLRSMTRDTNKDIVPIFDAFERYFNSDENYADTMIANAFQKEGVFEFASGDQRKRVIVFSLKYMVTFMATLEKLYSALGSCKANQRIEGAVHLDSAAGYFVGSLEGKEDGGSFDGGLIFMLAKRMCVHFGTCSSKNHAKINERIINLFYAGQGELETGACDPLFRTVKEIENAMIVPLIQATLSSALENELYFIEGIAEAREFYPEGYVLAQSILPIIHNADPGSAKDIKDVMVEGFPGPDHYKASDYAKVFRAMQKAVSNMDGVDCSQIGQLSGKGFCPGDEASYEGFNPAASPSISMVMLVITGMLLFTLY